VTGQNASRRERAVGYVRVSRVAGRDGDSFISPDVQRENIAGLAIIKRLRVVDVLEDRDQSGGKYERPGFQRAIELVESGRVDVIVCAKLNRFARSVKDAAKALERIEAAGGRVVLGDCDVDPTTPTGKIVRGVLFLIAEFELDVARENWQTAKAVALEKGKKLSTRAPIGYTFDASHRLAVDDQTADAVRELFRLSAAGASSGELVDALAGATGRTYYPQSIGHIIRNRAYVGDVVYGEQVKIGAHAAIVTETEWLAAQRASRPRVKAGAKSLLSGIVRCAGCGRGMGLDRSGDVPIYRCPRIAGRKCAAPASIACAGVDELVTDAVLAWAHDEGIDEQPVDAGADDELISLRELERRQVDELERFAVTSANLRLDASAVEKGLAARQEAVTDTRERIADIEVDDTAAAVRTSLRSLWHELDDGERRKLIASVVDAVSVTRRERGRRATVRDRVTLPAWLEPFVASTPAPGP
jgi:DNA invertase Pin-like site-specific DNA recombinase